MKELASALIEFQFKCPAIEKDAEVKVKTRTGHDYKFQYASFGNIVQTIKKPMYDAKLAYTFLTQDNKFICRIIHASGEHQDTGIDMPKLGDAMQENGSKLTYCKRYTLVLALGLDTDLDDDGNSADGNQVDFKTPPREAVADVEKFINEKDLSKYRVKVGKFKNKTLGELDQLDIQNYLTWLHGKAKENNKALTGDFLEFAKIAEAYISPNS